MTIGNRGTTSTKFLARLLGFASTFEQAAGRYSSISSGPVEAGGFYYEGTPRPAPLQAQDEAFRAHLWKHLRKVTAATSDSGEG
jgi:hypothetical protein